MKRKDHPTFNLLQERSDFFCTAKWTELYLYLNHGLSNSCHHPIPHHIPAELLSNPTVLHNTPHKLAQQQLMIDGKRPDECHMCWHIEDLNDETITDRIFKSTVDIEQIDRLTVDPGYIPRMVEVVFDNTCNLSCSYCDGGQSSSWATKINHQPLHLMTDYRKLYSNVPIKPGSTKEEYFKAWLEWLPEIKNKLQVLKVSGGEPLLSKNFWKFFEELGSLPQLRFNINSNLSVDQKLLSRFIEKAKDYKKLNIAASIDAVGDMATYARQGLNYEKFISNVEYWCQHSPDNCTIYLQSTVNVFNIFGLTDMFDLSLDLRDRYPTKVGNFYSTVVRFPEFQSIAILPRVIKDQLANKIDTWYDNNVDRLSEREQTLVKKISAYLINNPKFLKEMEIDKLVIDLYKFIQYYDTSAAIPFAEIYPTEFVNWINSGSTNK
jgi:organic radical activating enzyme